MYAPARVVTNDDLAREMDTSDEWIRTRTGIERRHVAAEGQATVAMAIEAAREALRVADADPLEIGLVLVATMTPDFPTPSSACLVQSALGAIHAGALDINAGCSGFVYGLALAQAAIASGQHETVLVIGAETMSRITDMQDRSTAVLFGDGAGALLLRASEGSSGVLATHLGADGSGGEMLMVPAGGSAHPATAESVAERRHYIHMEGAPVFRFATQIVPRAVERVLQQAGLSLDQVDWFVPHQANARIIDSAANRLGVSSDRFIVNLHEYGNTSAASIPIALCEAVASGRVTAGQRLVLVGFGAGLTWGAAAIEWGAAPAPARLSRNRLWRWIVYRWAAGRSLWRHLTARFYRLVLPLPGMDRHTRKDSSS